MNGQLAYIKQQLAYIKQQNVFRTTAFRVAPVLTLWRLATWLAFHVLPKWPAVIKVNVGDTSFRLRLVPILRHHGSSGIYVLRSKYEPLLEYCDRLVTEGAVVMDCGANQGIYACAFGALVRPRGRVYAFEPQAYAAEQLCQNAKLNGFAHLSVEQVAISNENSTATLDLSSGPVVASIMRNKGGPGTISVPTISLTSFAERVDLRQLDLIKMDIEGAEYDALVGAGPIIARFKPTIVLEATEDISLPVEKRWTAILKLMTSYGYAMYRFSDTGIPQKTDQLSYFDPNVVSAELKPICLLNQIELAITLALQFAESEFRVMVLESRGEKPKAQQQTLNHGQVADGSHPPAHLYRPRRLGTGGACR